MSTTVRCTACLIALTLGASAMAQTPSYYWYPTGSDTNLGGNANAIPLWSFSATYQQVHHRRDLAAQGTVQIWKGLVLRPPSSGTIAGRKNESILDLSPTSVEPLKASTTFSLNHGAAITRVFGGTDSQGAPVFASLSWSTNTATAGVNPPVIMLPFSKPFVYATALGHICWEWRYKNASIKSSGSLDAAAYSATANRGVMSFGGTGCKTSTARFTQTTTTNAWRYDLNLALAGAPANTAALYAIGLAKQSVNVGWCAPIQVNPMFITFGATDSSGGWNIQAPMNAFVGLPAVQAHAQFVYTDAGQAAGLGLSDLASYTLPALTGAYGVTRIYKATSSATGNGDELATTGALTYSYGLVTGFQK